MSKLAGKIALVTGASRGIGKSIAGILAAQGARVVCTARTLSEGEHPFEGSLETTVKGIRDAGGQAEPVVCDVSDFDAVDRAFEQIRSAFGPIDILVNNAALTYFLPVAEFPLAKWRRSLDVNFNAPFWLARRALEDMIPRRSGAIVNISSSIAIGPGRGPYTNPMQRVRGGTLYGAEKAALERFTQGLAAEVYEYGITVACVSPSQVVATPGTLHHRLVRQKDDPRAESSELMARAVLLLVSEPLDKVTGRVSYSQLLLKEFGWIDAARGPGVDRPGSGYSQI
jgi:citronellol/citronellal dehydrogenase